ncbi:MAG: hypothetical protein IKU84_01805 [Clostridia bacterium]|nr:hypothetical protein [Clostridia bacterium]
MKMKTVLVAVMVIAAAIGIFAIAVDYGTQSDPLVSLSYITDVFTPDLLSQAKKVSDNTAKTTNANISNYEARVDKKVNEFIDRNTATVTSSMIDQIASQVAQPDIKQSAPFNTIDIVKGKSLVLAKGCEVLVRSGTVSCKSGNLVDATTGGAVASGGSVANNHLYITADSVTLSVKSNSTVLVKGGYSLN